jgi:hypothetical protein
MADPNENAHLQQQQQELSRQIEVAEQALKNAKSAQGGATQTLQNQLQGYKDELKQVEAKMKAAGMSSDPKQTQREFQADQAREQANIQPAVDVKENKEQDRTAAENLAPQGKKD